MKKSLLFALAFAAVLPAQTPTVTPNLGLFEPAHGTLNWDTYYNTNWGILDAAAPTCINVKSKGAKGDGVTDDSTAIQTAITTALATVNGGCVYLPASVYMLKKSLTILKGTAGGFTIHGDGPHATIVTAPITGFAGTAAFSINSNGGAMVFRDMAVSGGLGGVPGVDGIYTTGNGQFFENLWLAAWGAGGSGAGLHVFGAANIMIAHVAVEHNSVGINLDTSLAISLDNSQTYQNIVAGIQVTGQIPPSYIGGTGGYPPGDEISNIDMMEDTTGGGGNAAMYINGNTPLSISNISVVSNNNARPQAAIFMDSGANKVDVSNLHVGHLMNYGIYATAGNLSVNGGTIEQIGQYTTITVPTGGFSSTTQCAAIFAGQSVTSLLVTGLTIRNVAGFGILSGATYTSLVGNQITNFGTGNTAGGQQNATTGLTGIALAPAQTYAEIVMQGNVLASSNQIPLTAFSLNPVGVNLSNNAIHAVQNSAPGTWGSLFSTTVSTANLLLQTLDLDGTYRFYGGQNYFTGFGATMFLSSNGQGGNPSFIISNSITDPNARDFSFYYQPGTYAEISTTHQNNTDGEPIRLQPQTYNGRVLIGTTTDNGVDKVQINGTLNLTPIKSTTGTRFLCVNTTGQVVSQTSACSGT